MFMSDSWIRNPNLIKIVNISTFQNNQNHKLPIGHEHPYNHKTAPQSPLQCSEGRGEIFFLRLIFQKCPLKAKNYIPFSKYGQNFIKITFIYRDGKIVVLANVVKFLVNAFNASKFYQFWTNNWPGALSGLGPVLLQKISVMYWPRYGVQGL